jgi:oligoendopeptidase F
LDNFWSLYEVMGVSLIDIHMWKWMYEHPDATAAELRQAVVDISQDVWNTYYAAVFGVKDQPILAVYSHMVSDPLYLSNYSFGHLIDFQIEQYMEGKNFGTEVERIFSQGRLTPKEWMIKAVGKDISVQPMLSAVDDALKNIKK